MRVVHRSAFLLAAGLLAAALPAAAQDVTYRSATQLKLGGALGAMMRAFGSGEVASTTYLSGARMRVDDKDASTIIDAKEGSFTMLDHKSRTYTTMTLEDMRRAMDQASAQMKGAQAREKQERRAAGEPEGEVKFDYKVDVERTGEKEKIAGYDAQRSFVTLSAEARVKEEGKSKEEKAGTIVVLVDTWTSSSVPTAAAMKEFQKAFAAKTQEEFGGARQRNMGALLAQEPQLGAALAAAAKETAKLPGVPLRTATYVVLVSPELKFDRQLALSGGKAGEKAAAQEGEKKAGKGLFGKLKQAAQEAAQQSQQQEGAAQKDAPAQGTMMTVIEELKEITPGPVPADKFAPPAGYKEKKPEGMR